MPRLTYTVDDTIHIFAFHEQTRYAVDEYMNQISALLAEMAPLEVRPKVLRVVLDISESGMFPLKYALSKARSAIGGAAYVPQIYYAYITDDKSDISIIKSLDYYSPSPQITDTRRIFPPEQMDDAKKWLNSKSQ